MSKILTKIIKYAVVGVLGTLTHFSILTILVEVLHCRPVVSSTVGFICTLIISYYFNYTWTFASKSRHIVTLPRYTTVSLIGLCLNASVMYIAVNIFNLWYATGQAVSVIIIPTSNFLLNSYWSFKTRR
jgi:putative flippase GtrA